MFQNQFGNKKGISIIEIIVVIAIIVIAFNSLLALASFSFQVSSLIRQNVKANSLARETIEIVRNFRDGTDWETSGLGTLTSDTDYYPQKSGPPLQWQLLPGTETIDNFTRKIVFKNTMRDANSNIVESGGILDSNTKKVIVTIAWTEKERSHQIEFVTYLTNWQE